MEKHKDGVDLYSKKNAFALIKPIPQDKLDALFFEQVEITSVRRMIFLS